MRKTGNIILAFCLVLVFACFARSEEVKVHAQIGESRSVYLGDEFAYQIIIDGVSEPGEVDLEPLEQWSPSGYAGQNLSQRSITIINGERSVQEVKRYIMQYNLKTFDVGEFTVPSVDVTVDGKSYKTNRVKVNVLEPGKTDKMEVKVKISDEVCYAGQPVTVTIDWFIFEDVRNYILSFPGFELDSFYFANNPAFMEVLAKEASLDVSGLKVPAYQKEGLLGGRTGLLVRMQKVLIPKSPGRYELGKLKINADVAVGSVRNSRQTFFRDPFNMDSKRYERFVVESQPISLEVKPLPEEGRPEGFYGLVGNYEILASAQASETTQDGKLKVAVGEPITLTVKIGPANYTEPIKAPNLFAIPEFSKNFRMPKQQSDPEVKGNYKIFTQTIRAENDNVTEIPSIPLAYFDVESGSYKTAKSEPIPIEVTSAEKLTVSDFVGGDNENFSGGLEMIEQGLNANYESDEVLEDRYFSLSAAITNPAYLWLWAGPLGLVVLSGAYKVLISSSPEKRAVKLRKSAFNRAAAIIKQSNGDDYQKISAAMKQFIGERFSRPWQSLTSGECSDLISNNTGNDEFAREYGQILKDYELTHYSPVKTAVGQDKKDSIIKLMKEIDKKAK